MEEPEMPSLAQPIKSPGEELGDGFLSDVPAASEADQEVFADKLAEIAEAERVATVEGCNVHLGHVSLQSAGRDLVFHGNGWVAWPGRPAPLGRSPRIQAGVSKMHERIAALRRAAVKE